jgi:hypothetical protein
LWPVAVVVRSEAAVPVVSIPAVVVCSVKAARTLYYSSPIIKKNRLIAIFDNNVKR